ncbi:MAG: dCTP deaminase [Candidatus Paceibacteria bacterium]
MALSDKTILEALESGKIIIDPFYRRNLGTSSYDVSLGPWFFREKKPQNMRVYNVYNAQHAEQVWGREAEYAQQAQDVLEEFEFIGLNPDDRVILIEPGETILAHTQEFIGGKQNITTMMKARSSMGRNFLEVCKCAGWGDVGYVNRWTMEITNNSRYYSIPLVVGRRIAQIIFFEVGDILEQDYTSTGKYQQTQDLETIKTNWQPTMMLPKMYNDREIFDESKDTG